jgi:hypothetical protein
MVTDEHIFHVASRDARANNYPVRDEEKGFIFPRGMREILDDSSFLKTIKAYLKENRLLKKRCKDAFDRMISKSPMHEDEISNTNQELVKAKLAYEETFAKLEAIEDEIEDEEMRLTNAGFEVPYINSQIEENVQNKHKLKKTQDGSVIRTYLKSIDLKPIKKWMIAFFVIVILEAFFGLALWDSLRDQKSVVEVFLRIGASGLLVVILHLSEVKYKKNKKWYYAVFIVYGILSLLVLLVGSLALGYFFPEYIDGGNTISDSVFDLTGSSTGSTTTQEIGFIGFFIRYDFIIGILGVVIFMLISFLDTTSINPKRKRHENPIFKEFEEHEPLVNKKRLVFGHLMSLYRKRNRLRFSYKEKKQAYQELKEQPSQMISVINEELKHTKTGIQEMIQTIEHNENETDTLVKLLESHIESYKMIFLEVFNKTPSSEFVIVDWPNKHELLKYYQM